MSEKELGRKQRSKYSVWQRGAAWVLCFCLIFALSPGGPLRIFGQEEEGGICPHHTQHDDSCGYVEAVEGAPCQHIHTAACYAESGVYGVGEDTALICGHSLGLHDESCGYVETVEGAPCQFVCPVCTGAVQEVKVWNWDDPEELLQWVEEAGMWGLGLPGTSEENPLTADALAELLPQQIILSVQENSGTQNLGAEKPGDEIKDEEAVGDVTGDVNDEAAEPEDIPATEKKTEENSDENNNIGEESAEEEMAVPEQEAVPLAEEPAGLEQTKLDITWDLSQIPDEGVWEGTYTVTASLPEGWVLAADAPQLQVILAVGEGALLNWTSPPTKYVNNWNYVGSLMGQYEFGIRIDDLDNSSEKIIERLEELLPEKIYGSIYGTIGDGNHMTDGCFEDVKQEGNYIWGNLNIEWPDLEQQVAEWEQQGFNKPYVLKAVPVHFYDNTDLSGVAHYVVNSNETGDNLHYLTLTIIPYSLNEHIAAERVVDPDNTTVNLFDYWVADYGEFPEGPQGDILPKSDKHLRPKTDEYGNESGGLVDTPVDFSTNEDWAQGINDGHLLLFGDGLIHAGLWNKGAGQNTVYGKTHAGMMGIVEPVLQDGYPVLDVDEGKKQLKDYTQVKDYMLAGDHDPAAGEGYAGLNIKNLSDTVLAQWDGNASLSYLFDPEAENDYKKVYEDVGGLFQMDDDGYYYYDMRENFAEYDADSNSFILYDNAATMRTDGDESVGNFFPFNTGAEVFNGERDGKLVGNLDCARNTMNHHLGMTVELTFRQPPDGKINVSGSTSRQDMTFDFSGDDDVWVFIDDVLVLDIGGTHSELYGSINFATGDVYIGRSFDTHGIPENPADKDHLYKQYNLKDLYVNAGKADEMLWSGNTYASNTDHTLKMFYLERGNYDSSLALRFNFQPTIYQHIKKVDQDGRPISGVEFELYAAEEVEAGETGAIACRKPDGDGETVYVLQTGEALATLTTGADGTALFKENDEDRPFDFADRDYTYYVLRETKAPAGYREMPVPVVLEYNSEQTLLTVANRWSTGAYSSFTSSITGNRELNYGEYIDSFNTFIPSSDKAGDYNQMNGLVVALPLLYEKNTGKWQALYGNNTDGWHTIALSDADSRKAVLQAVLMQAGDNAENTPHWYLAWDTTLKRLKGDLQDLPGMAHRYQLTGAQNDMKIIYAIIDPAALTALGVNKSTAEEKYEALGEYVRTHSLGETVNKLFEAGGHGGYCINFLNMDQFIRDFRSMIYIPNEQRELWVWKIDQDGKGLNGVEFGLFSDEDCTQQVASGITATVDGRDGVLIFKPQPPKDNSGNMLFGYAKMEWVNPSNTTKYYLKELSSIAGYDVNQTVTPVVVGIYSVYADAGSKNNGVSVLADVGKLTQTMVKYASDGDVNITLRDIMAIGQQQESGSFDLNGWQDMRLLGENEDSPVGRRLALHYKNGNQFVDYGLHDADLGQSIYPFFVTDSGFVRARVEQNTQALREQIYEGSNNNADWDDLTGADLTNLFSLLNIVVVTNEKNPEPPTGMLEISKMLEGDDISAADMQVNFEFAVSLLGKDGKPLTDSYYFYGSNKSGQLKDGDRIRLHHDESITVLGLPVGSSYKIEEIQENGFYVRPASGVINGIISQGVISHANFVNSKQPEDPNAPKYGQLTLRKQLQGSAVDTEQEFSFKVTLTDGNGNILPQEFAYTGSRSGNLKSGDIVKLKGGEYITIKALPENTKWQITEQEANQDGYTTTTSGDNGSVAANGNHEAVFTNSRQPENPPGNPKQKYGDLTLRKELKGSGVETEREFRFVINLTNSYGEALTGSYSYTGSKSGNLQCDDIVTLKGGEYITIKNLPEGAVWAITELEADEDGYTTTTRGDIGTVVSDGRHEAVFVNSKQPDEPKKPEDPKEPEKPKDPEKPNEPVDPKQPDNPTHPELPDPNDPNSPDIVTIYEDGVPKTYVKVYDPENDEYVYILEEDVPLFGQFEVPQTGDDSHLLALLAVCILALGAIVLLLRHKPRKDG